jgi:hypothetical protein
MPEEAPPTADQPRHPAPVIEKPTPSGRALVGTLVSLGLYLSLRKLTTGGTMAALTDADGWWLSSEALTAVFVMQGFAAGFGAVVASAGRTRGIALGSLIGSLCGGSFLAAEIAAGAPPTQLVLLLQPVLLAVIGAIAGALGAWVWPGVPEFELPPPLIKKSSSIELLGDAPKNSGRPTVWYRVLLGAMVILIGITMAERARTGVEKASGGLLKVSSRGQGKFMSWQFATLAVLIGGAFAGAGTGAGVRHGLFTGILGGIGVAAMGAVRGEFGQAEEYLLTWMKLAVQTPQDPVAMLGVGSSVLAAAVVGGWFGGQLFLPLAPAFMRSRHLRGFD